MKAILFVLLILILSCKNTTSNLSSKQKPSLPVFNKEIFPRDSFWLKAKNGYENLINLSSIEQGVDSFEFRFWIDEQLTDGDHVFCVKHQNNKWKVYNYYFNEYGDDDLQLRNFDNFSYNIGKRPFAISHIISLNKSGFESFLKKTGIDKTPTQSSLKNYKGCCFDGTVYFVEIATKNSYKFCVYENPLCCKEDASNQQFLSFINLFERLLPKGEYCWPRCIIKK